MHWMRSGKSTEHKNILPFSHGRYPQVIFEEIIPQIIPIGGDFMLNYALICDMNYYGKEGKSRSKGMIKVLFVCHGSIHRWACEASKIKEFR